VVRDVRAVLGRARESIHLQKSYERTRPRRRTRTAGGQRSSRSFRTSMNTCSAEFAGQRRRRAPRTSKERSRGSRSMEGTSGLAKVGRIGVRRSKRAQTIGIRALCVPPCRRERCQRARLGRAAIRRKSGGAPPHEKCSGTKRGGQSTQSRQRAVQARSRWRLNDRKVVQRAPGQNDGNVASQLRP